MAEIWSNVTTAFIIISGAGEPMLRIGRAAKPERVIIYTLAMMRQLIDKMQLQVGIEVAMFLI